MIIFKVFAAISFLVVIYLLCLKPNSRRHGKLKPFEDTFIAHRGLFDEKLNIPENSMKAFERAIEYGFGIELDVRLTKDKELVVFHDDSLYRMCGLDKEVFEYTYSELRNFKLNHLGETIPKLSDVLKLVDSKVPLIIEIKAKQRSLETAKKLSQVMKGYKGVYCVQSFNPLALGWYRWKCPKALRGQLSSGYSKDANKKCIFEGLIITYLIFNWYTKPDYIALNFKHESQLSYKICRKLYKVKNAAWTIKSQQELEQASKRFQIIIFDNFIPERKIHNI